MPEYLSDEWHAAAKELAQSFPDKPGASVKMAWVVTASPRGDLKYFMIIENGKILDQGNGELADAEMTMTAAWEDSVRIQKGELDANAAFMQGKVKLSGNMGKAMALMPLTMSPEYKAIQEKLREITTY